MGRVAGNTKIGEKRIILVRGRGKNMKHRALKLDHGNFSWGSEAQSCKTRIIDVLYNATNNELVRTKTLVKNAIIKVDATPFRQWYLQHYDIELNKKKMEESDKLRAEAKHGEKYKKKIDERKKNQCADPKLLDQFTSGKLLACISSRPGQSGRCDGYILEGKELEFYLKKIERKR